MVAVLGITRIIELGFPKLLVMKSIFLPAAKLTTTAAGLISLPISAKTEAISCGFTTKRTASASRTLSAISVIEIPYRLVSSVARSARFSQTAILAGVSPYEMRPAINASPIFPAPITAVFISQSYLFAMCAFW